MEHLKGKTIVKPTVRYNLNEVYRITVGMPAMVHPIDHSSEFVSNENIVETSRVLNVDGHTFETENTIYVGVKV